MSDKNEDYSSGEGDGIADYDIDNDSFTTLFIIFELDGSLFPVRFADISMVTGGLGVNSNVNLPTIDTVLDFPLIRQDGTDTKAGPLAALKALLSPDKGTAWFAAREDSFWVAAGLKVTAFTMLAVDAVLVLQLNPDVQLGIYGVVTMDFPSLAAPTKFAHAELGIACTLDIGAGVSGWMPNCRLARTSCTRAATSQGGLSLYAWFCGTNAAKRSDPDRPADGDFVLTIGGYHLAFVRPPQYPNPPRLGSRGHWATPSISRARPTSPSHHACAWVADAFTPPSLRVRWMRGSTPSLTSSSTSVPSTLRHPVALRSA